MLPAIASCKIGFWGTGNMAKAMIRGLLARKEVEAEQIVCISKSGTTAKAFAQETGVRALETAADLISRSDILILAFKPFQLDELSPELEQVNSKLVLSILAGTSLEKLKQKCPKAGTVIRTMPNTPGRIGQGVTAYCSKNPLNDSEAAALKAILGSLGEVVEIEESLMDVFTAVAGSGPAYVFEFIAALAEAGETEGLPRDLALDLARQTVLGAASLARQANEHPEVLRNQVTSKGGTTEAGLRAMSRARFRQMILDTVRAAKARSIEMGK